MYIIPVLYNKQSKKSIEVQIMSDNHLKPNEKVLLWHLQRFINISYSKNGLKYCYPSISYLSKLIGVSDRQVINIIKNLERLDYIFVDRDYSSNRYYILSNNFNIVIDSRKDASNEIYFTNTNLQYPEKTPCPKKEFVKPSNTEKQKEDSEIHFTQILETKYIYNKTTNIDNSKILYKRGVDLNNNKNFSSNISNSFVINENHSISLKNGSIFITFFEHTFSLDKYINWFKSKYPKSKFNIDIIKNFYVQSLKHNRNQFEYSPSILSLTEFYYKGFTHNLITNQKQCEQNKDKIRNQQEQEINKEINMEIENKFIEMQELSETKEKIEEMYKEASKEKFLRIVKFNMLLKKWVNDRYFDGRFKFDSTMLATNTYRLFIENIDHGFKSIENTIAEYM